MKQQFATIPTCSLCRREIKQILPDGLSADLAEKVSNDNALQRVFFCSTTLRGIDNSKLLQLIKHWYLEGPVSVTNKEDVRKAIVSLIIETLNADGDDLMKNEIINWLIDYAKRKKVYFLPKEFAMLAAQEKMSAGHLVGLIELAKMAKQDLPVFSLAIAERIKSKGFDQESRVLLSFVLSGGIIMNKNELLVILNAAMLTEKDGQLFKNLLELASRNGLPPEDLSKLVMTLMMSKRSTSGLLPAFLEYADKQKINLVTDLQEALLFTSEYAGSIKSENIKRKKEMILKYIEEKKLSIPEHILYKWAEGCASHLDELKIVLEYSKRHNLNFSPREVTALRKKYARRLQGTVEGQGAYYLIQDSIKLLNTYYPDNAPPAAPGLEAPGLEASRSKCNRVFLAALGALLVSFLATYPLYHQNEA